MKCPICQAPAEPEDDRRCVAGHTWWMPNRGPQTQFLSSTAFEVLYGGAAGGGKSASLVADPLRYVGNGRFQGIAFRRTFPELEKTLIAESLRIYPLAYPDARYNSSNHKWVFPSGATIYFAHLQQEIDVHQYQGAEFQWVGFDETTHFSLQQYTYMISRMRTASGGIPMRMRAATNPGGPGHDWVLARWSPWLDRSQEYMRSGKVLAAPGEVLWVTQNDEGIETFALTKIGPEYMSRTFIPAFVSDNAQLMKHDPGYAHRLNALDPLSRKRLKNGDWLARPARGLLFKEPWFRVLPTSPAGSQCSRIRYWDRGATTDGDFTVGTLMAAYSEGIGTRYVIEDVIRMRGRPDEVEKTIMRTANQDGRGVQVGIEQDPGAAGKFEAVYYVNKLAGWNVQLNKVSADKVQRAQPLSAQSEQGNVSIVKGEWNRAWFSEMESFPEGEHDDQADSASGAFSMLTTGLAPTFASLGQIPSMPGPRI